MTWDEFKEEVERQLSDKGKDGTIKIIYIDCNGGTTGWKVQIYPSGELVID